MPFYLISFGRARPRQVSPLGICAAPRVSGDVNTDDNFCISPVVNSVQNSFLSIISFDAQGCPCEEGSTGALISIF